MINWLGEKEATGKIRGGGGGGGGESVYSSSMSSSSIISGRSSMRTLL